MITCRILDVKRPGYFLAKDTNTNKLFNLKTNKDKTIKTGEIIQATGYFEDLVAPTNPGQFNAPFYYKTHHLMGIFKSRTIKKIGYKKPNVLYQFSEKTRQALHNFHKTHIPYPYSDIFIGLLIGDKGIEIPEHTELNFRKTGLTHLLVVSGSQVSLIFGIFLWALTKCNFPKKAIPPILLIISCWFYLLTGGGISVLRSLMMGNCCYILGLLNRNTSAIHILSFCGVCLMIWDPFVLYDVGAWLSFAATGSLLFGTKNIAKKLPGFLPEWTKESLSLSLSPFLWTTPILWITFNTLSSISLFSNILAVPIIELMVILGFISSGVAFVIPFISIFLNNVAYFTIIVLNTLITFLAQLSWGTISLKSPPLIIITICYIPLLLNKYYKSVGLALVVITIFLSQPPKQLTITCLDIGQGDATLVQTPSGKTALIDTGPPGSSKNIIIPALNSLGINSLDLVIITHFDADHTGGLEWLSKEITIKHLLVSPHIRKYPFKFLESPEKIITEITAKTLINLDNKTTITFYYPFKTTPLTSSKNDYSLVAKLSYVDIDMLFTGDLEEKGETILSDTWKQELQSEILQVGHHGSTTSSTPKFLQTVAPSAAIISAGRRNRYHHPHKTILERFKMYQIPIYRTDKNGAIIIKTNGRSIKILHLATDPIFT